MMRRAKLYRKTRERLIAEHAQWIVSIARGFSKFGRGEWYDLDDAISDAYFAAEFALRQYDRRRESTRSAEPVQAFLWPCIRRAVFTAAVRARSHHQIKRLRP